MNNFYTYIYTDPSRNEPIYVGKGCGKRAWSHLHRTETHPFVQRLQKMKREGVEPVITFLCENVDEELALLCEEMAIEKYGRKDLGKGPLLNLTDGGEAGWSHGPEARSRISAAMKNRVVSDATRAKLRSRQVSDETKAKLSVATLKQSEETKEKKRTALTGQTRSEETKAKLSAAWKRNPDRCVGRPASPCSIFGVTYQSVKDAALGTNMTRYFLLKHPDFTLLYKDTQ